MCQLVTISCIGEMPCKLNPNDHKPTFGEDDRACISTASMHNTRIPMRSMRTTKADFRIDDKRWFSFAPTSCVNMKQREKMLQLIFILTFGIKIKTLSVQQEEKLRDLKGTWKLGSYGSTKSYIYGSRRSSNKVSIEKFGETKTAGEK